MPGHVRGQASHLLGVEGSIYLSIAPAAHVHSHQGEGLVEGHQGMGHADQALALPQGLPKGPSQDNGHVLDQVVAIGIGLGFRRDLQVEGAVLGQLGQHVVQHGDAGLHLILACAVDDYLDGDPGLAGVPFQDGLSIWHRSLLLPP